MATHSTHDEPAADMHYEKDVEGKGLVQLAVYGVVLTAAFFATCAALFVYFRWEADQEIARKIDLFESPELVELRKREAVELGGVDAAMKSVAQQLAQPGVAASTPPPTPTPTPTPSPAPPAAPPVH